MKCNQIGCDKDAVAHVLIRSLDGKASAGQYCCSGHYDAVVKFCSDWVKPFGGWKNHEED